jgi:uncharacterized coiled-coil protein SlyX
MMTGIPKRLVLALALGQLCGAAMVCAQTPSTAADSVADAAKRSQEQKKNAASAKKVITDDDLSTAQMKPGDEGLQVATPKLETEAPSPAAVAADEAADKKAQVSPADDPLKTTDPAKLAELKAEVAQAEEALQLSQRESALAQDTYYSNPDYAHDTAGKAKLADLQQTISDKQQTVEQLKARLAEMEESLKKEAPAAPATENAPPPPAAETPATETPATPPQR